ncbi:Uncharacterised protein [Mycobacteroides abscessus subsp. abscessus]|uniref:hypothetical protein n=1 Tax=Mycobacteroides abscessus TaxID=36809 RepID=UPI0005E3ED4D|nr:hypothetical protein [Mycobacteroides abscessus]ANO18565.1 hypothetical protein BAB78_08310 [Mycobacteroides abscessus]MDB2220716.1 hypothetical protein [Mycobacteroides abscessus subsp. abscessus]OTR03295.1 hypothetical protein B9M85_08555 [Mycobacteroides abscessus]CPR84138.1 Uncharacterised protein [Mycobacteroides abscessus]SHT04785.1 Uncharacterised protein [Mycobacteroides abscessus subsp. abscessus]
MDDLLQIHPEALLSFAQQLDERALDLEAGLAAERAKVEDAVRRSGSLYTRDGRTAPVFRPMGKALGSALDKAEENVGVVTATLRNDAMMLREFVAAHQEAEARAARGYSDLVGHEVKPRGAA